MKEMDGKYIGRLLDMSPCNKFYGAKLDAYSNYKIKKRKISACHEIFKRNYIWGIKLRRKPYSKNSLLQEEWVRLLQDAGFKIKIKRRGYHLYITCEAKKAFLDLFVYRLIFKYPREVSRIVKNRHGNAFKYLVVSFYKNFTGYAAYMRGLASSIKVQSVQEARDSPSKYATGSWNQRTTRRHQDNFKHVLNTETSINKKFKTIITI